jgi:hypothetical protein
MLSSLRYLLVMTVTGESYVMDMLLALDVVAGGDS